MKHPEPFDMDLDGFLQGDARLDIDQIFAKDFATILEEFTRGAPEEIETDDKDPGVPSIFAPELTYREVPAGIVLFHGEKPIGGYLSCDLSLTREYQGRGLGAEIVIERCLRDGSSPVLALDSAAYSPAGYAAHAAAWRHARSHVDETATRVNRNQGENQ